jgi:hypothetical protein
VINIVLSVLRPEHCGKYLDLMGEGYIRLEKIA